MLNAKNKRFISINSTNDSNTKLNLLLHFCGIKKATAVKITGIIKTNSALL